MAHTTDAAISLFYAAEARDCACGCGGGCHDRFDGAKVYDAALRTLVKHRDAGFDESKHKRSHGQFAASSGAAGGKVKTSVSGSERSSRVCHMRSS